MKKLAIAIMLSVSTCIANAQNVSDQNINLMAASTKAVDLYKSGGMNGLFSGVNDCYQKLQQKKTVQASDVEFCVGLDLSGVLIDSSMARAGGFRRDDRFLEDTAIDRMNALLTAFGVSKEVADTQNYVGARFDRVQRYTGQEQGRYETKKLTAMYRHRNGQVGEEAGKGYG